jgi:hypothetical protein
MRWREHEENESIDLINYIACFLLLTLAKVSAQTAGEPTAGDGIGGFFCFFYLCIMTVPSIVLIIAAFMVYNDAKNIGVDNPVLWGLVAFFASLAGILVYILVIRPKALEDQKKRSMGSSGLSHKDGACNRCGKYVGAMVGRCPYCGSDL